MHITILQDGSIQSSLANTMNTLVYNELSTFKNISWYTASKEDIKPCIGCFNCWIKTPGKCIMKDITASINKDFINSDLVIYVTPLVYGSYSPAIKRTLDHLVPILLPFFKKIKNEVHHKQRYPKRPKLIMLAYNEHITDNEKETFISLTKANALNLDIPYPEVYFCTNENESTQAVNHIKNQLIQNLKEVK